MPLTDATWLPRSPYAEVGGYVWLPRLLDKARRESTLGAFRAFDKSPIDQAALRGWRLDAATFRAWVAEGGSDEAFADRLAAHAGHDEASRRAWSRKFLRDWALAFAVIEADDGRLPGLRGAVLGALMPAMSLLRRTVTGDWQR